MQIIENQEFGGERPLFGLHDARLARVVVHAGESALKHVKRVAVTDSQFEGKYPFWHAEDVEIEGCRFTPGARAAIWYVKNVSMTASTIDAPKMFRDASGLTLTDVVFTDAMETLWNCASICMKGCRTEHADYLFMHSQDITIEDYVQHGNYSFQYCRNITIANAEIHSKDAFWNSENITVRDSLIDGEYLGWHTKGLTLINCRIKGTQPFCYCEGLKLVNCTMDADCDLGFEYSEVDADVAGPVTSIKNPTSGRIRCASVGELILDENRAPGADCVVECTNEAA